jgi:hypothetical protein
MKNDFRTEDEDFSKDIDERKGFFCEDDGISEDSITLNLISQIKNR